MTKSPPLIAPQIKQHCFSPWPISPCRAPGIFIYMFVYALYVCLCVCGFIMCVCKIIG